MRSISYLIACPKCKAARRILADEILESAFVLCLKCYEINAVSRTEVMQVVGDNPDILE
ncbi:hypothetical protein [Dethiobacter alkaliphilus]|uniref:Uncharacterized protein n=1 Tax=Dethiobacter alkaliphilus AHT 1 TaxID=555088 RepID=C0GK17_DETAL|nr:hypothetical protein [Dethiobacter alkaliphilus]EEG76287.1 hypothetical protein DealDRAFT_2826 [Dethiobacter alkaliphilus AHT 1]